MRDPVLCAVIVRTMRKAVRVPLTVKIRGGWDDAHVNAAEIARIAEAEGADGVTVHPRTRSQQFTGRAPWDIIGSVVAAVRVPVIGNGDVRSVEDARAMATATGCAAVMIGRGALGAPWVFTGRDVDRAERGRIVRRHVELIEALLPPRDALVQLKKHLAWYLTGRPHVTALRPAIFQARDADAVKAIFWRAWAEEA
jgi:hypothetical protein